MTRLIIAKTLLASGLLLSLVTGHSAVEGHTFSIQRTLVDEERFGKCMIYSLEYLPSISCPKHWVSLDCGGNYHSKSDGSRMWDSVQLAMALDLEVRVFVNDARKVNGYCVAYRVDILK